MNNSICLPVANLCNEIDAPPRCFVCFKEWDREVRPYKFTEETIESINEVMAYDRANGLSKSEWWCTLFFPEDWPPGRIKDFLTPPIASENSGIHLPIVQNIDDCMMPVRCFVEQSGDFRLIPPEPFTSEHVFNMLQETEEICYLNGTTSEWCLVLWFPAQWLPHEIEKFLRSWEYQEQLFPL